MGVPGVKLHQVWKLPFWASFYAGGPFEIMAIWFSLGWLNIVLIPGLLSHAHEMTVLIWAASILVVTYHSSNCCCKQLVSLNEGGTCRYEPRWFRPPQDAVSAVPLTMVVNGEQYVLASAGQQRSGELSSRTIRCSTMPERGYRL